MSLFIETAGQGKDVVLFDGGLDNYQFLSPIKDRLITSYQVTTLDQPGIGGSEWQSSIKSIADMVEVMLPHMPQKAIYIGWSFGGLLNVALAAHHPDRVERIINIASSPRFVEDDNWPGVPKPGFYDAIIPGIEQGGLSAFLNAFVDAEYESFNPKPPEYYKFPDLYYNDGDVDFEAVCKRIKLVDDTDLREAFKTIQCPIDYIFGADDAAVPTEVHDKILALNANAKKHVIANSQHMMFWTHRNEFNKVLGQILES